MCPPGMVRILPGDLSDAAFRQALWEEAERLPGGCEVLFNNAGSGYYGPLSEQPLEAIEVEVETNLVALIDLTRLALRTMIQRGNGQIVEVASVLSVFGIPYSSVYVATKHAVLGLVRSLQGELRGTKVRVWAACPGRTKSEFASVAAGIGHHVIRGRKAEPTERVVRGILAGLDRETMIWSPTWMSWCTVEVAIWLNRPFQAFLNTFFADHFRSENDQLRSSAG